MNNLNQLDYKMKNSKEMARYEPYSSTSVVKIDDQDISSQFQLSTCLYQYNLDLTSILGPDEAVFIQRIIYLLDYYERYQVNKFDNTFWINHTDIEWETEYPSWPISKIKELLNTFENRKILLSKRINENRGDLIKWYTIDQIQLNNFINKQLHKENN